MTHTTAKTILVVEDDGIAAMAVEHLLTAAGFTVLTAGSGEEAVSFVRSEKNLVDLILMDLDLGAGMDGAQAARLILDDQDVPVIFVSAHTEKEATDTIVDIPSFGFVAKNSGDPVLLASIRMAFKLQEANRALTQSAETEDHLRQTRERFRVVFNNINDSVFIHGFDEDWTPGLFVEVNDIACVRYGYTRDEFLRMSPADIDTHESGQIRPQRMARLRTEGSAVWEAAHLTKSGQVIPVEISNVVFLMDGKPMILSSVRDISERKRAEDALRRSERMLNAAQEVARIGHHTSNLVTGEWECSPMMETIMGIDASYPHDHLHWNALIAPDMREAVTRHYYETVKASERFVMDYKIVRANDGQVRWVSSIGDIEYGPDGTPLRMIGTIQDITDRSQLEHQLIQAQKLEAIGTLAGGIAHDFNNLLAMILGSAELLRTHTADQPQLKRYVDRIIEASERGASISRQLLIFSKPDGAEHAPIPVAQLITELTEMLAHFMSKSISIESAIDVENGTILGDLGQIHQALLNIALNAGDAMPDGGTLSIRAYPAAPEAVRKNFPQADSSSYIAVSVADTGKGMNDDIRQRIFDPFFTTKDRGKGTGLGLAIVHGIMKNHNGFIDVESIPGAGAAFTLYFPGLARQNDAPPSTEEASIEPHGETILIVDDEIVIREALQECLEGFGYTVFAAANGADALRLYQDHQASIDLVITDLGMPGIGGEELFRRLRSINGSVNVMISSGYLEKATVEKLMDMGVKKLLAKPYRMAEIQSAIRSII